MAGDTLWMIGTPAFSRSRQGPNMEVAVPIIGIAVVGSASFPLRGPRPSARIRIARAAILNDRLTIAWSLEDADGRSFGDSVFVSEREESSWRTTGFNVGAGRRAQWTRALLSPFTRTGDTGWVASLPNGQLLRRHDSTWTIGPAGIQTFAYTNWVASPEGLRRLYVSSTSTEANVLFFDTPGSDSSSKRVRLSPVGSGFVKDPILLAHGNRLVAGWLTERTQETVLVIAGSDDGGATWRRDSLQARYASMSHLRGTFVQDTHVLWSAVTADTYGAPTVARAWRYGDTPGRFSQVATSSPEDIAVGAMAVLAIGKDSAIVTIGRIGARAPVSEPPTTLISRVTLRCR